MRRNIDKVDEIKLNNKEEKPKKHYSVRLIIWLILLVFVVYQVFQLGLYTLGKIDKSELWLYNAVDNVVRGFADRFKEVYTTDNYTLNLAALGDVYASSTQIANAKTTSGYDFSNVTKNISESLKKYDIILASLNTSVAPSTLGYSNKSVRNSPAELLQMLKNIGVSSVLTATNHVYDKSEKGVTSTIDAIEKSGISQFGINATDERLKPLVVEKNSIKIGLLSYTTKSEVKIPSNKSYLVNILDENTLKEDVSYLKKQNVDFIIAYICTPNDSTEFLTSEQKNSFDMLYKNGVNLVFGTGTSIVQDKVEDLYDVSETEQNHVFGIYSLGEFYGIQDTTQNSVSLIGDVTFKKSVEKDSKGNIVNQSKEFTFNKPTQIYAKSNKNSTSELYNLDDIIKLYNDDKLTLTVKIYNEINAENARINELY